MGLDIKYFAELKRIDNPPALGTDEYWEAVDLHIDAVEQFPGRAAGLTPGAYAGRSEHFRAGSYSGYNRWREGLSRMALGVPPEAVWRDPSQYKGKPFFEIINFSDCEGVIGPVVSSKLRGDFEAHAERARAASAGDEAWWLVYERFAEAFRVASRGGAVEFR